MMSISIDIYGLEKYPVKTYLGEYKVTIDSKHVAADFYTYVVKIYVKRDKKIMFGGKFKRVYEREIDLRDGFKFREDLVGLTEVVRKYEESKAEEVRLKKNRTRAVNKFENWNGDMRREDD